MLESHPFPIVHCDKGSSNYERAEELRVIAEDVISDDCHDTLIRLANSYEQMAVQAVARLLS